MVKIAAVCTAYHEADVIRDSIKNLQANDVTDIYVKCPTGDDETITAAKEAGAKVFDAPETFHDQARDTDRLATLAEAEWIIPFDADELHYTYEIDLTLRKVIESIDDEVGVVQLMRWRHWDWWWRELTPIAGPKVIYRWCDTANVGPGSHGVHDVPGNVIVGRIGIRERQYRSAEHFVRKVHERNATLDPNPVLGKDQGFHHKRLEGRTDSALRAEFERQKKAEPKVWDPIPYCDIPPYPGKHKSMSELLKQMEGTPCDIRGHLRRLRDIVIETGATEVLECGTNTGMSTIAFLASGATVFSLDIVTPRVRPELFETDKWIFCEMSDLDMPPGKWRVIFIDTTHTYYQTLKELRKFWPMVLPGGCLIMHDTVSFPEESRAIKHWLHEAEHDEVSPSRIESYDHDQGLIVLWK